MQEVHPSDVNNHVSIDEPDENHLSPNLDQHHSLVHHYEPLQPPNGLESPYDTSTTPARAKKRKAEDPLLASKAKRISPPWKKVEAEGPSSFVEGGRRKSTRTNLVPLELQPQGNKRQTRGGYSRYQQEKHHHEDPPQSPDGPSNTRKSERRAAATAKVAASSSPITSSSAKTRKSVPDRKPSSERPPSSHFSKPPSPTSTRHSLSRKSAHPPGASLPSHTHAPTHARSTRRTLSKPENDQDTPANFSSPRSLRKIPKLRLWYTPPPIPVFNPGNMPPKRKFSSLQEFLREDEPLGGEDGVASFRKEAVGHAHLINRIIVSGRPGGALDQADLSVVDPGPQEEIPQGHAHPDYLALHAVDLQSRMQKEAVHHRALAKRIATQVAAEVRRRGPQSPEDREAEIRKVTSKIYGTVLSELRSQWMKVATVVRERKVQEFLEQENAAGREQAKRLVDQSEGLLIGRKERRKRATDREGTPISMQYGLGSNEDSLGSGESASSNEDDSEISSSSESSEEESGPDSGPRDDQLTVEELQRKYANIPDYDPDLDDVPIFENQGSVSPQEPEVFESPTSSPGDQLNMADGDLKPYYGELEEVDDDLLDRSSDDSDEDTDESSQESWEVEEDDDEDIIPDEDSHPLLSILPESRKHPTDTAPQDPVANEKNDETTHASSATDQPEQIFNVTGPRKASVAPTTPMHDAANSQLVPVTNSTSEEPSRHSSPSLDSSERPRKAESVSSIEPSLKERSVTPSSHDPRKSSLDIEADVGPQSNAKTQTDNKHDFSELDPGQKSNLSPGYQPAEELGLDVEQTSTKVSISSLLRGKLRGYQYEGFDWLARMYENDTNGILADEMGLGKTIQTIALLAHLATEHHVWGPHLVVVPTSVILNWEMEFKKFCPGFKILTYYGTMDERRAKRKGWTDPDKWHVLITSYTLAVSDAVVLKKKKWHYLVLDEAHNIKNFQSQRWQTLLAYKSRARLLLTGTPLQNNLTELWSLLYFLASKNHEESQTSFGDLAKFSKAFRRPVDQILEAGKEALDEEAQDIVNKLHKVLRPHLLRRLKADVEKQMPKKYEHVMVCRLSKRQRQLYDEYMHLKDTKNKLTSGNYMSIIDCLMQLRKVCNHPDLFETRQIVTSFAMSEPVVSRFAAPESAVRRLLPTKQGPSMNFNLLNMWDCSGYSEGACRSLELSAAHWVRTEYTAELNTAQSKLESDPSSVMESLTSIRREALQSKYANLQDELSYIESKTQRKPMFPWKLLKYLRLEDFPRKRYPSVLPENRLASSSILDEMIVTVPRRSQAFETTITRFGCITPAVTAPGMARHALTDRGMEIVHRARLENPADAFHEPRIRMSIAFPDKGLIQYDCGKLQELDRLLRRLQAGGHRTLIFTQMTKVLDILERFLNLHGHRYLRLDGSTRIEQRQALTERFNSDPRILAFILSSRSGGLGINLTGADSVIFYDLDWNPAMDKQCQDRCHRIGQTREVHIYRFISEGTIEANILRKSNQKRMLDDVVIQEGDFTTQFFDRLDVGQREAYEDADAALNKVFGEDKKYQGNHEDQDSRVGRALGHAEDKEDQAAARDAEQEDLKADAEDAEDFKQEELPILTEVACTTAQASQPALDTEVTKTPPKQPVNIPLRARISEFTELEAQELDKEHRFTDAACGDFGACRLPQDDAIGDDQEPNSVDMALLRFMEYDMRDYRHVPLKADRKPSKKKKA